MAGLDFLDIGQHVPGRQPDGPVFKARFQDAQLALLPFCCFEVSPVQGEPGLFVGLAGKTVHHSIDCIGLKLLDFEFEFHLLLPPI